MNKKMFAKGDIIFVKYLDTFVKPRKDFFVIFHCDHESIRAIELKAFFEAIKNPKMNDKNSEKIPSSDEKDVKEVIALHLFAEDLLPEDLKGHLAEKLVYEVANIFQYLEESKKIRFNVLS